ncbi:hypothetical protein [Pseudobacteroides cellulosolvens]|uniref:Uncharacterized protein n=1 Tax=Pseudobacteroides cellulosolvens ATCC 35603 = DSM 2933 TaxID=398512 RepID=A0A0L6JQZ5_9FIRM|nr:hypothetical protein [Pseudobacteroides cellulosolvens]KNY28199.1 hypothetical protein Bccel_3473 [Pseudobacteroides cellulosolvens ATCC 35603 = DSM 2933]
MKKNFRLALITVIALILIINTGCSMPSFLGGDDKTDNSEDNNVTIENSAATKKVKKVVSDYFIKAFSQPIEKYNNTAIVPEDIKPFISKRTISEGENNPEIGIHLPRYIELNGMVVVEYQLMNALKDKGIETTYIGKSTNDLMYYTKVQLMAKCLPDIDFYLAYKQNPTTKLYEKQAVNIDENKYDYFRIVASYDITVVKDSSDYKIKRAVESSTRPGYQNRVLLINNDFVERFPYINTDKTPDGKEYANKEDGSRFDNESKLIEKFFTNFKELDNERMNLLKSKWFSSQKEFADYSKGILKLNIDKDKKEIMQIDDQYKTKFNIDSFPLKSNMGKVLKLSNFEIIPHPAYTKKQSKYIVKFEATIEMMSGIIGQQNKYKYDYFVVLNNDIKSPKVSGIYMNSIINTGTEIVEK